MQLMFSVDLFEALTDLARHNSERPGRTPGGTGCWYRAAEPSVNSPAKLLRHFGDLDYDMHLQFGGAQGEELFADAAFRGGR